MDHVVNQCYSMRKDLISLFPQLYHNSSVIYNPLSAHIEDYMNKYDLTKIKKENYILCVGRLEQVKAFHYAIEGFAGIANQFPKLRLKIVGQGSLEQNLKQKAIDCNVENILAWFGCISRALGKTAPKVDTTRNKNIEIRQTANIAICNN